MDRQTDPKGKKGKIKVVLGSEYKQYFGEIFIHDDIYLIKCEDGNSHYIPKQFAIATFFSESGEQS